MTTETETQSARISISYNGKEGTTDVRVQAENITVGELVKGVKAELNSRGVDPKTASMWEVADAVNEAFNK